MLASKMGVSAFTVRPPRTFIIGHTICAVCPLRIIVRAQSLNTRRMGCNRFPSFRKQSFVNFLLVWFYLASGGF
jgi:hypothetical protein